jgi:release factor glutamine methyltransferase
MQVLVSELYKTIKKFASQLKEISACPEREVEEMFMSVLGLRSRGELYTREDLPDWIWNVIEEMVEKRKTLYPLQYITKRVSFYGYDFKVEEGVFIPRPETEILLDYAVKEFKDREDLKVLEIGTGTGVIAICLTKLLKVSKIIATDISDKALKVAGENACLNKCNGRILFVKADLFNFLREAEFFDLIVSNPPYVGEIEYDDLEEGVKFEPKSALIGGKYGYEFTLKLIKEGKRYLKNGGKLILEISPKWRQIYEEKFGREFNLQFIEDLNGLDRVMCLSHG